MPRMKAHVWVMLKSSVLDPQGTAIQQALASLGHAAVRDVRQGKFFVLDLQNLDRAAAQASLRSWMTPSRPRPASSGKRGRPLRDLASANYGPSRNALFQPLWYAR